MRFNEPYKRGKTLFKGAPLAGMVPDKMTYPQGGKIFPFIPAGEAGHCPATFVFPDLDADPVGITLWNLDFPAAGGFSREAFSLWIFGGAGRQDDHDNERYENFSGRYFISHSQPTKPKCPVRATAFLNGDIVTGQIALGH